MQYIIQILAAILFGISIAAIFGTRTTFVIIGAILAIAFAVATLFIPSWWVLWGGVACFMVGQLLHRDKFSAA